MTLQEQKRNEANKLEAQAAAAEKAAKRLPMMNKIFGGIGAISWIAAIIVYRSNDMVISKRGLFGIPTIEYTPACWGVLALFLLGFCFLIAYAFSPSSSDSDDGAARLRSEAQKIRNMSDEEYSNLLTRRKIMATGKLAYKLGKAFLGG